MQTEFFNAYTSLLVSLIKVYFLGSDVVQKEINFFTNNELKDGLIFYLLIFGNQSFDDLKERIIDINSLNKYVIFENGENKLTNKGKNLHNHLKNKFEKQVDMLELNNLFPNDIAKMTNVISKFYNFWRTLFA